MGYTDEVEAIKLYLRNVKKYTGLLPLEDEQELAERISRGDEHARTQMIDAYLKLVVEIGEDYLNSGLLYSDIIQEGNIGLMRAVSKYDYKKGIRFRTYAIYWIRRTIEKAIMNQEKIKHNQDDIIADNTIISPSQMTEDINMLDAIDNWLMLLRDKEREVMCLKFGLEGQKPVTLEEIENRLGLTRERITQIESSAFGKLRSIIAKRSIRRDELL